MLIDYKSFGKRIKKARIAMGLTQEDIAEKADLSIRHISKIESGRANPTIEILINLANILETTPDYLLFDNVLELRVLLDKEIEDIVKDLNYDELKIIIDIIKFHKETIKRVVATEQNKFKKKIID